MKQINYSNKLNMITFLLLSTLIITGCVGYGGQIGKSREIIFNKTYDILVKNKYCKDIDSCPQQGFIFITPTLNYGLIVETYGITDYTVIESIKNTAYIEYKENNGSFSVIFIAQKETWEERQELGLVRSIWYKMFNEPLIEIKFERIEK